MKKIIFAFACLCIVAAAQAEELNLVTFLAQPVGSFASVELLDGRRAANLATLNFCTVKSPAGTIETGLKSLKKLRAEDSALLTLNVPTITMPSFYLNQSGEFEGKSSSLRVLQNLYGEGTNITVVNKFVTSHIKESGDVEFKKMKINDTANLSVPAVGDAKESSMSWRSLCNRGESSVQTDTRILVTDGSINNC